MKPTLASLFPNASQATADRNPQLSPAKGNQTIPAQSSARRRGNMNKTEAEFAMILEAQKRAGEILRYEFEGITLRWEGVKYTPDFVVFRLEKHLLAGGHWLPVTKIKLIEAKGGCIKGKYERAVERFRHARTFWREFSFEMHHRTKQGWKRIH